MRNELDSRWLEALMEAAFDGDVDALEAIGFFDPPSGAADPLAEVPVPDWAFQAWQVAGQEPEPFWWEDEGVEDRMNRFEAEVAA